MNKVYITDFDKNKYKPRDLFPLVRPFLNSITGNWEYNFENLEKWDCLDIGVTTTSSLTDADFILISEPINQIIDKEKYQQFTRINNFCKGRNIYAYAIISGDYGKVLDKFSNIIYYRLGGFKSQLDQNNKAFAPFVRDQLKDQFKKVNLILREKKLKPTIGFCGHASGLIPKVFFEKLKLLKINWERAKVGDFNFEPLYSSGYERYKLLKLFKKSKEVNTNFILRKNYRAGAVTQEERKKSSLEFIKNINDSDYILCLRGAGNFSVRLYETLMMGRIPIFVNTDCLLPMEDVINWKEHVIWVEWEERKKIPQIVADFHNDLTRVKFHEMQINNRKLWETYLKPRYFLERMVQITQLKTYT